MKKYRFQSIVSQPAHTQENTANRFIATSQVIDLMMPQRFTLLGINTSLTIE
jgi:hypothetical protein